MPTTYLFTVDNVGQGEQVVVQSACRTIRLRQNDQSAAVLQPFLLRFPTAASPAARREGGDSFEFTNPSGGFYGAGFYPGQIIGYIELVNAAAVSFAQEEF